MSNDKIIVDKNVRVLGNKAYKSNNLQFYNVFQASDFSTDSLTPIVVSNLTITQFFEKKTNVMILLTALSYLFGMFIGGGYYQIYIDNVPFLSSTEAQFDPAFEHYLISDITTLDAGQHTIDVRGVVYSPFPEFGLNELRIEDGVLTVIELVK